MSCLLCGIHSIFFTMRHYYPNIDPPWEDDEVDDDEALYDAEESYKENLAMEEYYEEKYGA